VLSGLDLGPDGLVVLGRGQADAVAGPAEALFALVPLAARDDKGQGGAGATGAGGATDAVSVGVRGRGEVKVDDAGDVDEIDAARDAVLRRRAVVAVLSLALLRGLRWRRGLVSRLGGEDCGRSALGGSRSADAR
jgi:hypothetical protein